MFLRLIVLVLLLANGVYYAWAQGLLSAFGVGPVQQSEPQRLTQQIRPEALRILSAEEVRRLDIVAAGPKTPADCLQIGPFEDGQVAALRARLAAWPAGSWALEPTLEPARWIVYMGGYPDADSANRKKGELRAMGVSFQPLVNPGLEPGISLGGYRTEQEANAQLGLLAERGVRTARVLVERAEQRGQLLRLPAVDDALRTRIDELKPVLAGRTLRACR